MSTKYHCQISPTDRTRLCKISLARSDSTGLFPVTFRAMARSPKRTELCQKCLKVLEKKT
jgi:hypothetical protein